MSKKGQFKPGNKAAVGHGRPRISPDVKRVRNALFDEIARAVDTLQLPKEEAVAELGKKDGSILYGILARAIKNDDYKIVQDFMERLIGKPKQSVQLEADVNNTNVDAKFKDLPKEKIERILNIIDE